MTPTSQGTGALQELRDALRIFAVDRNWDQFHTPKNLAISISVEASELLEHFQWITDEKSKQLDSDCLMKVQEEMADVLLYLIRLADKLDVDLIQAAALKIKLNAERYPVEKAKGSNRKYTDL